MARLSIDVSEELRAKLAVRAAASGHSSVEAYVAWLVQEEADSEDFGAPPRLQPRSAEHLEQLLLEGLDSPTIELTPEHWAEKRAKLQERFGKRKAP